MPVSWSRRLQNLHNYFWPHLFSHGNYILGVRPLAQVPAPHEQFGYVWIESGYTWLLWVGGIPFLVAYLWFAIRVLNRCWVIARRRMDGTGIASAAMVCAISSNLVVMLFDPHLTYRGTADVLVVLLALSRPLMTRAHASAPVERAPAPVRTTPAISVSR